MRTLATRRRIVAATLTPALLFGGVVAINSTPSPSNTEVSANFDRSSAPIKPVAQFGPIFVPDQLVGVLGSVVGSIILTLILRAVAGQGLNIGLDTGSLGAAGGGQGSLDSLVGPATGSDAYTKQLVDDINHERSQRGLNTLTVSVAGSEKSEEYAKKLLNEGKFEHADDMRAGVPEARLAAENIYSGPPRRAHESLMASPGHRKNILWPEVTHVAIGVAHKGMKWVVVERFYDIPTADVDNDGTLQPGDFTVNGLRAGDVADELVEATNR